MIANKNLTPTENNNNNKGVGRESGEDPKETFVVVPLLVNPPFS